MNPGELNRKITFGTFTQSKSSGHNYVETFVPVLETWAKVRTVKGNRQLQGQEPVLINGTEITIRYRRDFAPTKEMFILYNSQYYVVHSVHDWEDARRFYKIFTEVRDGTES